MRTEGEAREENDRIVARLLDLEKAYPRVSKPGLWMSLEKYGLKGKMLETLIDLHETTEYKVFRKEDKDEFCMVVRKSCSAFPILFNIYHQAREARAAVWGSEVGVEWRWIPSSSFWGTGTWERNGSEVKEVRFRELLFADDTTIVGTNEEMDGGVNALKEVIGKFEERSNDQKEDCLDFWMEESESIGVLGSWVGTKEDVNMRLRRAGGLWAKVEEQLKNTRLSKRSQARIVQARVESALLFDCEARVWWEKDVMRWQKWMDKCWRYVWNNGINNRNEPFQMTGKKY